MKRNTGPSDRIIRSLGAVLLFAAILLHLFSGTLMLFMGMLAFYLLATSIIGICPLYNFLGIHTCTVRARKFDVFRA